MCRDCLFQRNFEGFRLPACRRERQHVEAAVHSAEVNHATFGRHLAPCRHLARHGVLQFVGNVLGSLLRCHRLHGLQRLWRLAIVDGLDGHLMVSADAAEGVHVTTRDVQLCSIGGACSTVWRGCVDSLMFL